MKFETCDSCPFNSLNSAVKGVDTGPASCVIREFVIGEPFTMTCVNHPQGHPERDPVPIGPVFLKRPDGSFEAVRPGPDGEEIRAHLLNLASELPDTPHGVALFGPSKDEVVMLQLAEMGEARALDSVRRVAALAKQDSEENPLPVTTRRLVNAAGVALRILEGGPMPRGPMPAPGAKVTPEQLKAAVQHAAAQLQRATLARRDALLARNREVLERILAPGFVYTNALGQRLKRDEYLALYVDSGRMLWTSQELSEIDLSVFGDTAVLTCLVHDVGTWDGEPLDAWFRTTQVWKMRERNWVMLAGHATSAEPPAATA